MNSTSSENEIDDFIGYLFRTRFQDQVIDSHKLSPIQTYQAVSKFTLLLPRILNVIKTGNLFFF
jgi:hypothetical protein